MLSLNREKASNFAADEVFATHRTNHGLLSLQRMPPTGEPPG